MKQVWICVFLCFMSIPFNTIKAETRAKEIDDRSVFSYEISSVDFSDSYLEIKGWALLRDTQHFFDQNSHSYKIVLKSDTKELSYDTRLNERDLTKIMQYRGYRDCGSQEINQSDCNYTFKNVGFSAIIPLTDLDEGTYQFYLEIEAKKAQKYFRTKLYYPQTKEAIIKEIGDRSYHLSSSFKVVGFDVFYHTLVARTAASPESLDYASGAWCSNAYENTAYFLEGSHFTKIYDVSTYEYDITYFKVNVKRHENCFNGRVRVVEEVSGKGDFVYLPSMYVNYSGTPLSLSIHSLKSPKLWAENTRIRQYDGYNGYDYVKAWDKDDRIMNRSEVLITRSNVNPDIPGHYQTCYKLRDYDIEACGDVEVIAVATVNRYISLRSLESLKEGSLWQKERFKSLIYYLLGY